MSLILNIILLCLYPFTWFKRFENHIWPYYVITIFSFLVCVTHFIGGEWVHGSIFILVTLLWGFVLHFKVKDRKLEKSINEQINIIRDLRQRREEIQERRRRLEERIEERIEFLINRRKKDIKPKKNIKKFKL